MIQLDAAAVLSGLNFPALVDALQDGFASQIDVPQRQHFDIPNPVSDRETTLLVMPAWQIGQDIGIKLVTVVPDSHKYQLPSIQGTYVLMDAVRGGVKALIDAPLLTARRTAAASALASRFLSRPDSDSLFMVGTGTLATHLIEAHCAVRPVKNVTVWGRNKSKAESIADSMSLPGVTFNVSDDIAQGVKGADVISVATLSSSSLIEGQWLKEGQHLDLVGAYRPDMREADDNCLLRSRIFVDNRDTAIKETGDLAIPLSKGIIDHKNIESDLFALCSERHVVTRNPNDITLFKSVGHALEDLVAAQLLTKTKENAQ